MFPNQYLSRFCQQRNSLQHDGAQIRNALEIHAKAETESEFLLFNLT